MTEAKFERGEGRMGGEKASEGNSFQRFQWVMEQREGLYLAGDVDQRMVLCFKMVDTESCLFTDRMD